MLVTSSESRYMEKWALSDLASAGIRLLICSQLVHVTGACSAIEDDTG